MQRVKSSKADLDADVEAAMAATRRRGIRVGGSGGVLQLLHSESGEGEPDDDDDDLLHGGDCNRPWGVVLTPRRAA